MRTPEPTPPLESPIATVPPQLVCPEGTVPGWLGEDGVPTSCVGDAPVVDTFPPALPLDPMPSMPDVLAYTGPGDELLSWLIVVASALILGGLVVAAFRWMAGDE